jgi:hypothetical protein
MQGLVEECSVLQSSPEDLSESNNLILPDFIS